MIFIITLTTILSTSPSVVGDAGKGFFSGASAAAGMYLAQRPKEQTPVNKIHLVELKKPNDIASYGKTISQPDCSASTD